MRQTFKHMLRSGEGKESNVSMMLFALVEVVMIIVGIVLANSLEEKKEMREVTERATVLFQEVLRDLETDAWQALNVNRVNVVNNQLSDVLYNPESTDYDRMAIAFQVYYALRFPLSLRVTTNGYETLGKLRERMSPEMRGWYEALDKLMARQPQIEEFNQLYWNVVEENNRHNITTYPWWNRSTYASRPEPDFFDFLSSHECLAQMHFVVDASAHLSGETERWRAKAIEVYHLIKNGLQDTTATPHWMDADLDYNDFIGGLCGTYELVDKTQPMSSGRQVVKIFFEDGSVRAEYQGESPANLKLSVSGDGQFSHAGPPVENYLFTDSTLKVIKWTIQKDWMYRKVEAPTLPSQGIDSE